MVQISRVEDDYAVCDRQQLVEVARVHGDGSTLVARADKAGVNSCCRGNIQSSRWILHYKPGWTIGEFSCQDELLLISTGECGRGRRGGGGSDIEAFEKLSRLVFPCMPGDDTTKPSRLV